MAVEDDAFVEKLAEGLGEVTKEVVVEELKVADLIEGPNAFELWLDITGVGDLPSSISAGFHWLHRGSCHRRKKRMMPRVRP